MEVNYQKLAEELQRLHDEEEAEKKKALGWKELLSVNRNGEAETSVANLIIFLENYPKYAGKLKYNEYLRVKEYDGIEFDDFMQSNIYADAEEVIGIFNKQKTDTALDSVFSKNKYNPVKDYIKSLEWDGKKRIERLFIDLLEADDTELNRQMTRKWMIAAIKRTMNEGCKFDNMIVLQGGQGIGKSTICERLSKHFFSTISLSEIGDKDLIDKLNKTWIAIIDEMDTFNKKEMSTIKTFLSLGQDRARLAYARNTTTFSRHCVFIGSTNDDTFLRDMTSSVERRFWVIKCNKTERDSKIYDTMTDDYVDQLWAEAYHYYKSDPNQYLDIDAGLMEDFAKEQNQFKTYNDDDAIDFVKSIIDNKYAIGECGEVTEKEQIENYCDSVKDMNYINKIPVFIIKQIMKRQINTERSGPYLAKALGDEWLYKDAKYKNGRAYKSLVRKELKIGDGNKTKSDPFAAFDFLNK